MRQWHLIGTLKAQVSLSQGVYLLLQHCGAEDAKDSNEELNTSAESTEKIIPDESAYTRDAVLQRLATEIPDEGDGHKQRYQEH